MAVKALAVVMVTDSDTMAKQLCAPFGFIDQQNVHHNGADFTLFDTHRSLSLFSSASGSASTGCMASCDCLWCGVVMMAMPIHRSNTLCFLNTAGWAKEFSMIESPPVVVLLTAWEAESADVQQIQPLVIELIDSGCTHFVCPGKYVEPLHDSIDDVIVNMSLDKQYDDHLSIVTTWHNRETNDDVAFFFLYATLVSESLLLAFLEEAVPEDMRLKKSIVTLAHQLTE